MPADVYQVEIENVEVRQGKGYQTDELEDQLSFTFVVIDEGPFYGRFVWRSMAPKLVGGTKQSTLYQFLATLNGKGYSREECANAREVITPAFLNGLIGIQLRVSLVQKVGEDGVTRNKIASFLPVKETLPKYDVNKQPAF